jgi:hypothetical protein
MKKHTDAIDKSSLAWMPKSIWGPIKWKELHTRALANLPMDGEEKWFKEFIEGLPCPMCRGHFDEYVKDHPPIFTSRTAFFKWSVDAHNSVNHRNDKRIMPLGEALDIHQYTPDPL